MEARFQIENVLRLNRPYIDEVVLPAFSRLNTPTSTHHFLIAEKHIAIVFYSPAIQDMMIHALLHHQKPPADSTPQLTIHAWDDISIQPTDAHLTNPQEHSRYFEQGINAHAATQEQTLGVYTQGEETIQVYDTETHTAYFWTHDASMLPNWVGGAPFRTIFHWFLSEHNIHLIHGAVIGNEKHALLLSARGGSGKSTTSLLCLKYGLRYLADDYIAVETGSQPIAHSLYSSVKIRPQGFEGFPELKQYEWHTKRRGDNDDESKSVIFLNTLFSKHITQSLPLIAVCIPKITHTEHTTIVPLSKIQATLAIIPTTIFQLPLAKHSQLTDIQSIIKNLPCHMIQLGNNLEEIPRVIEHFLENN